MTRPGPEADPMTTAGGLHLKPTVGSQPRPDPARTSPDLATVPLAAFRAPPDACPALVRDHSHPRGKLIAT
jgi:hypothetical protein